MAKWPRKKPTKIQAGSENILERMAQADLEFFAKMRGMSVEDMLAEREETLRQRDLEDKGFYPTEEDPSFDYETEDLSFDYETPTSSVVVELPPPSSIHFAVQSQTGHVKTKRPDRRKSDGYYYANPTGAGGRDENKRDILYVSTRVHAFQWIPTTPEGGDLLVAFARPSTTQAHTLHVYSDLGESQWTSFASSDSLGKSVNSLGTGRLYDKADGDKYNTLHATSDDGDQWDYWIFNELGTFTTVRPNNEGLGEGGKGT